MFPLVSVDFASFCCRCMLGVLLIFCPYSFGTLSVLSRVFTGTNTRPLCASGFVHRQEIPLILSSHLLNVPLIVSWLNVIVCNRICTVIYKAMLISKVDSEKCLFVFCRCLLGFLSIFRLFSVDACLVFFSCSVRILFIFCSYYRARAQEPAQARFVPPDSSPTSGPTSCMVPLVKHPTYCIMTECHSL